MTEREQVTNQNSIYITTHTLPLNIIAVTLFFPVSPPLHVISGEIKGG